MTAAGFPFRMGSEKLSAWRKAQGACLEAAGADQVRPCFCEGPVSLSHGDMGQLLPLALSLVVPVFLWAQQEEQPPSYSLDLSHPAG